MLVRVARVTPAPEAPNNRGPVVAHILGQAGLDIPGQAALITLGLAAVRMQAPEALHTMVLVVAHTQVLVGLAMPVLVGPVTPGRVAVHIRVPAVAAVAQECAVKQFSA